VCRYVCLSICLLVTFLSPEKTTETIEMPLGVGLTQVGPSNHVLDGAQFPKKKGNFGVVRPTEKHCESLLQYRWCAPGAHSLWEISIPSNIWHGSLGTLESAPKWHLDRFSVFVYTAANTPVYLDQWQKRLEKRVNKEGGHYLLYINLYSP